MQETKRTILSVEGIQVALELCLHTSRTRHMLMRRTSMTHFFLVHHALEALGQKVD